MIEALWLISGFVGSGLVWRLFKRIDRFDPDFTWCPSPLAIFFALIASIGGPVLLCSGIVITGVMALDEIDFKTHWLTRPICKRRTSAHTSTHREIQKERADDED